MLPTVIIHDGDNRVDLCEEFGLVWTNDSVLNPPEAMTNMVSVPGMDGALDLTEVLTDDVVFGMRNDGLRLKEGTSSIYVNSAPEKCDTTWQDLEDMYGTWEPIWNDRWSDHLFHKSQPPSGAQYDVVIEFDVQDL